MTLPGDVRRSAGAGRFVFIEARAHAEPTHQAVAALDRLCRGRRVGHKRFSRFDPVSPDDARSSRPLSTAEVAEPYRRGDVDHVDRCLVSLPAGRMRGHASANAEAKGGAVMIGLGRDATREQSAWECTPTAGLQFEHFRFRSVWCPVRKMPQSVVFRFVNGIKTEVSQCSSWNPSGDARCGMECLRSST